MLSDAALCILAELSSPGGATFALVWLWLLGRNTASSENSSSITFCEDNVTGIELEWVKKYNKFKTNYYSIVNNSIPYHAKTNWTKLATAFKTQVQKDSVLTVMSQGGPLG